MMFPWIRSSNHFTPTIGRVACILVILCSGSALGNHHTEQNVEPSQQADGGDSAQKVEEPSDEPETRAVLVISSNPKLQVKLGGRIHRMFQFVNDGSSGGRDIFFTDSLQGPTMLRVDVIGKASDTLTVGGALELGLQQNSPGFVSQDNPDAGFNVTGRAAEIYLQSTKLGKFSLGRGFAAAWVSPEIDLSGTQFASLLPVGMLFPGLKFVNSDTGELSGVRVGNHFADLERFLIADRFRYDSPRFGGLQVSGSVAADSRWDVALRTRHGSKSFAIVGATTYQNEPFRDLDWRWDAGASTRHEPTGLNFTFGFFNERHRDGRDSKGFIVKAGWLASFNRLGKTAISADYTRNDDVVVQGDEARSIGAFVLQNWDDFGIRFYAGIRRYEVDSPLINLEPITVLPVGFLISF